MKFKDPVIPDFPVTFLTGSGVFIINEGNFNWGNGSISYYSYDSSKIYNDIFKTTNERPLGDIPNSMIISGDKVYIVVNNSGKIEVVEKINFKSVETISGLISPRNIAAVDNYKAYVTSLYSDSVTIIDLTENSVSGYINLRRTSESIVITGEKAFISNWVGGKEVMVINTDLDKVVDSIEVGIEPESMVLDKDFILWVLCNGGWKRENFAELVGINIQTNDVVKQFIFPSKLNSPLCLQTDGNGDTLYYIENGIKCMSINAPELPSTSLIPEWDRLFNKIGINPVNGDIFATDAVDYQQKGFILLHDKHGTLISSYQAGIIPSSVYFKVKANPDTD
jgi:hypothetical protein